MVLLKKYKIIGDEICFGSGWPKISKKRRIMELK
jgi:hypothetical protein